MYNRNIYISNPCTLKIKNSQINVINDDGIHIVPIDSIGSIVVENNQVLLSSTFLSTCSRNGIAVFFVDQQHTPNSVLIPFGTHSRNAEVLKIQLGVSERQKKKLWQQIVIQKIYNQSVIANNHHGVLAMSKAVKIGDAENLEAQSAAVYFPAIFGKSFNRRDDEDVRNALLNYGYSIIRGCIARSIVAHGLLPQIGIFHHNSLNAFNLADDLIEPYRQFVDLKVLEITAFYTSFTDKTIYPQDKASLISILQDDCIIDGKQYIIQVAIDSTVASLKKSFYQKTYTDLMLPSIVK